MSTTRIRTPAQRAVEEAQRLADVERQEAVAAQRAADEVKLVAAEVNALETLDDRVRAVRVAADDVLAIHRLLPLDGKAIVRQPEPDTMKDLLSDAGRSFLRAFAGSIIVLLPGILSAPELAGAVGVGIAAVIASVTAGIRALQRLVPRVTFASIVHEPWSAWLDSFTRAFLAALLTSLVGILSMPDLAAGRALITGALVGAVTAGLRAVQGGLTNGEAPFRNAGPLLPQRPETP